MNITNKPKAPPRRTLRRSFSILAAALFATSAAHAADWHLRAGQPNPQNWNSADYWNPLSNGTGINASAMSPADTYHVNNYNVRTPYGLVTTTATFGGGILRLSGGASAIGIKTTGVPGATIPKLESLGGRIENSEAGTVYLKVPHFNNISGSTQITSVAGRIVNLDVGTLVGSGELHLTGAGGTLLSLANASGYTGRIRLSSGTLNFDTDVNSSGPLVIEGGSLTLDQNLIVTALKVGSTTYPAGPVSLATLQSAHGAAMFPGSTGNTITVKPATTWYLAATQPSSAHWETLSAWKSAANGTGTSPVEFRAADTFDTNGKGVIFTPSTHTEDDSTFFSGGPLHIRTSDTTLSIRNQNTTMTARLPHLRTTGGRIGITGNGVVKVRIDQFENISTDANGVAFGISTSLTPNGGYNLSIGKLCGPGVIRIGTGTAVSSITVDDASAYTGEMRILSGKLAFNNNLNSSGGLEILAGASVILNKTIAVSSLTVAGVEFGVGTHTYAMLHGHANPQIAAIFATGSSSEGAIVVRSIADWYLKTSQAEVTDNWNVLPHWNDASDGTGVAPASINVIDNYNNHVSGRILRTPAITSTFPGGALVLKNGGKLLLQTPAGVVSTIPTLKTENSATIYNGPAGIQQTVVIDKWDVVSGTTTLTTNNGSAGGSLNLNLTHLVGAGHIAVPIGSHLRPNLDHGTHYTGTITVGGTLTVNSQFATGGGLVVSPGATVALNDWVYVTSLTANGTVRPLGVYDVSTLGAGFSTSNGSKIVVYERDLTGPPQMFGVNMAGAEFSGLYPSWQTNAAVWDYYQGKGLTLIRMPVMWSRIQPNRNGAVIFTQMDQCINLAAARGMKVIIDLHNYAAYEGGDDAPRLGSAGLPTADFVDVWSRIAEHYKNNTAVYGYDIMNEPLKIDIEVWSDAAQRAVNAIRQKDQKHYVLVEGLGYSSSDGWKPGTANGSLDIKDPAGRLIYSAHSYWDYQRNSFASPPYEGNDGNYHSSDIPTPLIGVNDVKPFVEWLKTRPYAHGNIGEYAVPDNYYSAGWNEALGNFLQHLRDNNISGTYWAGGGSWQPSPTVCHPLAASPTVDRLMMPVLQSFNNNP